MDFSLERYFSPNNLAVKDKKHTFATEIPLRDIFISQFTIMIITTSKKTIMQSNRLKFVLLR